MWRCRSTVLACVVLGALATPLANRSAAQAAFDIEVVRQDPVTVLGDTLTMRLAITGPVGAVDGLDVQVVAHPRVETVAELDETAKVDDLDGFKDQVEFDLDSLARFADGDVAVAVDLREDGGPFEATKLNIQVAGVYPLEVSVRDENEEVLASTLTWLVATDPGADPVAAVGWVWRPETPPMVELDGVTPTADFIARTGESGSYTAFVDRLEANRLALSVQISPQFVDAWQRAAGIDPAAATSYERLLAVLARRDYDLLATSYVPVDGPALEAGDLAPRLPDSFLLGAETLRELVGRQPDSDIVFADPVSPESLERLAETFAYRAIVEPDAVEPAAPNDGFTLVATNRRFDAIAIRRDLQAAVRTGAALFDPTLGRRIQYFFARVAVEGTDRDDPLPIIFEGWFEPRVQRAFTAALENQNIVTVERVGSLFTTPPTAGASTEIRTVRPSPAQPDSLAALELFDVDLTKNSFVEFVGSDHPAIREADANLRLVVARDISAAEMHERLARLNTAVDAFVSNLGTESKSVTLTDRRSDVPITFRNETERDVAVRITLSSSKLTFPDGPSRTITLPAGRTTQEQFTVEARASGTFPMQVRMTSVDGNLDIGGPTQITVRSAVFGAIGTWLTFGALGFLGLWWAHHFWRTRRARTAS